MTDLTKPEVRQAFISERLEDIRYCNCGIVGCVCGMLLVILAPLIVSLRNGEVDGSFVVTLFFSPLLLWGFLAAKSEKKKHITALKELGVKEADLL